MGVLLPDDPTVPSAATGEQVGTAEAAEAVEAVEIVNANTSGKQLARNAIVSYGVAIIGSLSGYIVTPILLHHLGTEHFGLWTVLGTTISYTGLLQFGISTAVAKRVAECHATGDNARLEAVLATALYMFCLFAVLALAATGILAQMVGHIFQLSPADVPIARLCLVLLGINQAVTFLQTIPAAILFGSGRLDLASGASVAISLGMAAAQVVLVLTGYGIVSLGAVTVLGGFLSLLYSAHIIRQRFPHVRLRPKRASVPVAAELWRHGSRNGVVTLCGMLAYSADTLVIAAVLPVGNVAYYAVASKLVNLVRTFALKPVDIMLPTYAHLNTIGDRDRLFRTYTESLNLALALALPLTTILCAFGGHILTLWVGPVGARSYLILVTLALGLVIQLPGHACFVLMTGTEKNNFLLKVNLVGAPVNLLLSVLLTRSLGPVGVALGSLITVFVTDLVLLPYLASRQFDFSLRQYFVRALLPLAVPSVVTIVFAALYRETALAAGLYGLAAGALFVCICFWTLWVLVGVAPEYRERYLNRLGRRANPLFRMLKMKGQNT